MIRLDAPNAYWYLLAFDLSPVLFVAIAWVQIMRKGWRTTASRAIPLVALTVSFFWLVLGLPFSEALGPSYSNLRYGIIDANFIGMVLAAGFSIGKMKHGRIATTIGCFLMSLVWAFIGAINSVI